MTYLIYIFFILLLVAIDQYSKSLVISYIGLKESIPIIKNFFNLTYVQNFGAGFSIMQNATAFFYILTPICLLGFGYLLYKTKKDDILGKISLILIIGGTIGNFIDRVINVFVIDFLDFYILGYDFPVFNFADMCLTVGVFLYIITIFLESKHAKA